MQSYKVKRDFYRDVWDDAELLEFGSALCSLATADISSRLITATASCLEFGLKYAASTSTYGTTAKFTLQYITSAGVVTNKSSISTATSATIGRAAQTGTLTGFTVLPGDRLRVQRTRQGKIGNTKAGKVLLYAIVREKYPAT